MTKILYRDRYRIPSARLSTHNYSQPGWYFITICTNIRYPWFGFIRNGVMCVNDVGSLAYRYWQDIPNHYNNVILDAFVVMPDHIHGIIRITDHVNDMRNHRGGIDTYRRDARSRVSTNTTGVCTSNVNTNTFGPLQPGSLSSIIHGYKSTVTRQCRRNGHTKFQWQPRYYDRIIRSRRELHNVRRYIMNNPRG